MLNRKDVKLEGKNYFSSHTSLCIIETIKSHITFNVHAKFH